MEFKYGIEYNLFLDFNIAKHIKNDINIQHVKTVNVSVWSNQNTETFNIENVRWQIYGRLVINFDKWADELMTYLAS